MEPGWELKVDVSSSTPDFRFLEGSSSAITGNICPVSRSAMSPASKDQPVTVEDF